MFKYLFTDGQTEIIAVELEPIRELSAESTLPGTKIRVIGPIDVRRGIWLLKRNNVEVLWANTGKDNLVIDKSLQNFDRATNAILKPKEHFELMKKVMSAKIDDKAKMEIDQDDSIESAELDAIMCE